LGLILSPILIATPAAFLVHLVQTRQMWLHSARPATLGIVLMVIATVVLAGFLFSMQVVFGVLLISAASALSWQAWEWRGLRRWLTLLIFVLLFGITVVFTLYSNLFNLYAPDWLDNASGFLAYLLYPITVVTLVMRGLHVVFVEREPVAWPLVLGGVVIGVILLAGIGYQYWVETLWDHAVDGLASIVLLMAVLIGAVAAAMFSAWRATGWRKLVPFVFAAVLIGVGGYANILVPAYASPKNLTAARAERVDRAIENYYQREGQYPIRLVDTIPADLLYIPQPVVFRDQTWCYEGGADFYRFGYVTRPAFGVPADMISIQLQGSAGEPPQAEWECDAALERSSGHTRP
jgi:MFS family permease